MMDFDNFIIATICHSDGMDDAKDREVNKNIQRVSLPHAPLIRQVQILRDSIQLSLSSKYRDTVEGRVALMKSSCEEINDKYASLLKPETLAEINKIVNRCEERVRIRQDLK